MIYRSHVPLICRYDLHERNTLIKHNAEHAPPMHGASRMLQQRKSILPTDEKLGLPFTFVEGPVS